MAEQPVPPPTVPPADPDAGQPGVAAAGPAAAAPVAEVTVSEATIKFRSCRWRRPPDEGAECCGHRDVLPIAGTSGFNPDAWCTDCTFFKLRRTPKKREDYRY